VDTQGSLYRSMTLPEPVSCRTNALLAAEYNELRVLNLVREFGHVRRSEIARAVWPKSSPRVAKKMAQRTVARLLASGQLLEKPNALGGRSLVLAGRGAQRLRDWGIDAQDGYDLTSVAGPQFFHRTLGTRYLIERMARGHQAFGEYALSKGWGPIGRGELAERFSKIPDGIVLVPGKERGYDSTVLAADWVEVESSYKPEEELERIFAVAWRVGSWLNTAETLLLDRVLFVYDARHRHENMILGSLKRYLAAHPDSNPDLLSSIVLVRCSIDLPLVWRGYQELDSAHLLSLNSSLNTGTN